MAANGASSAVAIGAVAIISHPGVDNVIIDQDNVNQLMDGAVRIEAAVAGVNDNTAIDAIKTLLGMMAMVIRILVKLIVNFSGHLGNFEAVVETKIMALQGQANATFEAARAGYESVTKKMDNQSMEMARVITDARDSFEAIKKSLNKYLTWSSMSLKRQSKRWKGT